MIGLGHKVPEANLRGGRGGVGLLRLQSFQDKLEGGFSKVVGHPKANSREGRVGPQVALRQNQERT